MYFFVQYCLWFFLIFLPINAHDTCKTPDMDLATHSFLSPFDYFDNALSMDRVEEFKSINKTFSMYKTKLGHSVKEFDSDLLNTRTTLMELNEYFTKRYRRSTTNGYDTKYIPNTDKCRYEEYGFCTNMGSKYPESVADVLIENNIRLDKDSIENEEHSEIENVCSSTLRFVYPQAALLVNGTETAGKWYYIVNPLKGNKRFQEVPVILCNKDKSIERIHVEGDHHEAKCEQRYHIRSMVAINYKGNIFDGDFKFPCCCVCYIEEKY